MAVLLLLGLGLCATSSFAQDCKRSEVTRSSMPPNVTFSTANTFTGSKVLATVAYTITLTGCTGLATGDGFTYNFNLPNMFELGTPASLTRTATTITGKYFISCVSSLQCFDDSNTNIITSTINTTGISFNYQIVHNGVDQTGASCLQIQAANSIGTSAATQFKQLSVGGRLTSACQSITITFDGNLVQTEAFTPSNTASILVGVPDSKGGAVISGFANLVFQSPFRIDGVVRASKYLIHPGTSLFVSTPGTCAVAFSPSTLSMGNTSSADITRKSIGDVVRSRTVGISIGNCSGFTTGRKKVIQWNFTTPNSANLTLMENAEVGGAKGISAQIEADKRIDFTSKTSAVLASNIVTTGENYITSGGTSDNQSLIYKVNLIKNGDAVVEGIFSTSATLTLFYK